LIHCNDDADNTVLAASGVSVLVDADHTTQLTNLVIPGTVDCRDQHDL